MNEKILLGERNHYTRRANLRSIIQDGSDEMPPNEGEGAIHII